MANRNSNLIHAKKAKNDEFYTQLSDIENELRHYKAAFKGKTVLCNCDDPRVSNFTRYFLYNFDNLGLKRLISTCYRNSQPDLFSDGNEDRACYLDFHGEIQVRSEADIQSLDFRPLEGDGDFRSDECIGFLKQADIVCTNPPFSLFKEYVAQLMDYGKQFIIMGNKNAITYKEIFPLIKDNKIWLGESIHSGAIEFRIPDGDEIINESNCRIDERGHRFVQISGARWFTNIDTNQSYRHQELILCKSYYKNPELYPKYDNYDAINVDKVADIPYDYLADIGVPVTYLDKHNPNQFEIIDANDIRKDDSVPVKPYGIIKDKEATITIPEPLTQPDEMAEPSAAGSRQQAAGSRQQAADYIRQNRHQKEDVMESWASQSLSSTSIIQSSSKFSESPIPHAGSDGNASPSSMGRESTTDCLSAENSRCNGLMGVPITFLDKYNPAQFEIIGLDRYVIDNPKPGHRFTISGRETYARILIRKRRKAA